MTRSDQIRITAPTRLAPVDVPRRALGGGGPAIFPIGLGCMGMSEFYGPADQDEALATLAAACDLGIDMLDTADTYGIGANEELLGRFLAGLKPADRPLIATKFGIVRQSGSYERRIDNSPAYIRAACDASLRRLGVEVIDLYYCHRRDPAVPIEDVVGAMAALVQAGKVRMLGLSEVSADSLRRAHAVHPIAALQSEYSLWSRDPEATTLPVAAELGTAFVAYSPLGRAFLTATVKTADDLAEGDFRRANPRFQGAALDANLKLAQALAAFGAARGLTAAETALAWILARQPHVIPIPGTTRRHHLAGNAGAATLQLAAADVAALDEMFAPGAVAGARYPDAGFAGIEA
ncbi:aldo/keto reductase [Tistrella bauzanensis]|uniref:Aldo/keto reductase n=1 Tax=Tistrella bauzanensis TaxID=657419 RepID=A0ABQ1II62_9PROT|nr:aldo/keto reductase [Tistrella bauzanensis]